MIQKQYRTRGRPRLNPSEKKSIRLNLSIAPSTMEKLQEVARSLDQSIPKMFSGMIQVVIEEYEQTQQEQPSQ